MHIIINTKKSRSYLCENWSTYCSVNDNNLCIIYAQFSWIPRFFQSNRTITNAIHLQMYPPHIYRPCRINYRQLRVKKNNLWISRRKTLQDDGCQKISFLWVGQMFEIWPCCKRCATYDVSLSLGYFYIYSDLYSAILDFYWFTRLNVKCCIQWHR